MLGLADEESEQVVPVDYGMSITDLYAEVTQLLVEASSWRSQYPLDVVVTSCWQRLVLSEPSWILDFSHPSTHNASWGQFDFQNMLYSDADAGAKNTPSPQRIGLGNELHGTSRMNSSQTNTTMCGGHVIVNPVDEHELRASYGTDPRTLTVSGFVIGVVRNIIPVHDHLLQPKTESHSAVVDESAIIVELRCSESTLGSAFRRFEDLHARHLCSVDQMAVFVTTNGDIGMCYSTMNNGRLGLDPSSPVLKAGDHVVCVYGSGSPLIRMPAVGVDNHSCLLLPCMLMQDCKWYVGQSHPVEAFKRMTFV